MKGQVVWGVHGLWTTGRKSVDRAGHQLAAKFGYHYKDYNYPHADLLDQRNHDKLMENARGLAERMRKGDHVIAHSNGAGVVFLAMQLAGCDRFGVVIFVEPAFGAEIAWPTEMFGHLVVIHNKYDRALWAGEKLYKHRYGALGRIGYQGPDDYRITSVNVDQRWTKDWPINHSNLFHKDNIDSTVDQFDEFIRQYG